jgi:hypothetical protein
MSVSVVEARTGVNFPMTGQAKEQCYHTSSARAETPTPPPSRHFLPRLRQQQRPMLADSLAEPFVFVRVAFVWRS